VNKRFEPQDCDYGYKYLMSHVFMIVSYRLDAVISYLQYRQRRPSL